VRRSTSRNKCFTQRERTFPTHPMANPARRHRSCCELRLKTSSIAFDCLWLPQECCAGLGVSGGAARIVRHILWRHHELEYERNPAPLSLSLFASSFHACPAVAGTRCWAWGCRTGCTCGARAASTRVSSAAPSCCPPKTPLSTARWTCSMVSCSIPLLYKTVNEED